MMKPNCSIQVCMAKKVMFPSMNKKVLSSSLMNIKIQLCARLCSFVLSGISKAQANELIHFHLMIT